VSASIKSLFVEDFQSHAKTKIELPGPGQLCVIVGPTDSGKTALVRALRLLLYNVPSGVEFIRVGRNMATVAVEMSDGTKVARERSKSVNRYRIARPGESAQVFEGFGLSVPLEVQAATGVRVVTIGDSLELALNLSEQLDGPFLGKTVSGPAKAKILGALAGTEEVDAAQRDVGLDLHRAGQDETRLANEIKALDAKIQEYDYLPGLAEQISALEGILAEVKETQARLSALESAKVRLDGVNAQRTQALGVLARWGGLAAAVSHVEYAEGALAKMQVLSGYKASLASIAAQSYEQGKRLDRWLYLEDAAATYERAHQSVSRYERLCNLRTEINGTRAGIHRAQIVVLGWSGLDKAAAIAAQCSDALSKLEHLYWASFKLSDMQGEREAQQGWLARLAGIEGAAAIADGIPALVARVTTLRQHRDELHSILGARVVAEHNLDRHTKALHDAEVSYVEALAQSGICPLCGRTVDPESVKSHIKEVA
jgi:exonuclease SbcC